MIGKQKNFVRQLNHFHTKSVVSQSLLNKEYIFPGYLVINYNLFCSFANEII